MMRIICRPAVVVLALVAIAFAAARMNAAPSPLNLTPGSKNFGNVAVGTESAPQRFTLKNNQNAAIAVKIAVTPEFTQTNNCGAILGGRQTCLIDLKLVPTSPGSKSGTLTIFDTSPSTPLASSSLSGTATTPVSLTPGSLSFGSQLIGATSVAKTISITNHQSVNLTGITSSISGDFAQASGCGSTLTPGASCTINVTFTPTVAGDRTGTLTINHSAVTSPQTAPLSGTGATPGLTSIQVSPASPSVPAGLAQQFVATGFYNNNTTADLTQTVTWTSSDAGVAVVSNSAGSRGLATSITTGTTTITASAGSISGGTTFTVAPAALTAIAVTPASPSIALGTTR
jgi:hypothetical protein